MADSTGALGVFPHAERRKVTGRGYVVREMESGYPVDQYNYGGIVPVAVFSKRAAKAAERLADKLTKGNTNPRRRMTLRQAVQRDGGVITRRGRVRRRAKKNPMLGVFGANPKARVVRELGRVVEVRYKRKDDGGLYFHKYTSKPRLLALSDGSIWIKGA